MNFVPTFILLLAISTPLLTTALEYGQRCIPSDERCNLDNFLTCERFNVSTYHCQCDLTVSFPDPADPTICLKFADSIGDNCYGEDAFCSEVIGAICNGTHCVCGPSHFQFHNYCVPYATRLNDFCSYAKQCDLIEEPFSAQCDPSGVCVCKSIHIPDPTNEFCLPYRSSMNQTCNPASIVDQCARVGEGVICDNFTQTCTCDSGSDYFLHPVTGTSCLQFANNLDDPCEPGTAQCAISGAECDTTTSTCRCDQGHVTTPNGLECAPRQTTLSGPCTPGCSPDQCVDIPGSLCNTVNSSCICNPSTHFHNGGICQTLPAKPLDLCVLDSHCLSGVPNSICRGGQCLCDTANGWHLSTDALSCIRLAEFVNDECQGNETCRNLADAECSEGGTCSCITGTIERQDGRGCLPVITKLKASCRESPQCSGGIGDGALCPSGLLQCDCGPGYVGLIVDGGVDRCLPISAVNGTCEAKIQCESAMGPYSDCVTGRCGCNPSAGYWNNRCIPKIPLNSPCSSNEECFLGSNPNAHCLPDISVNICQCLEGRRDVIDGKCYGTPKLSERCVDDFECGRGINGSVSCVSGVCWCDYSADSGFLGCSRGIEMSSNVLVMLVSLFLCLL